MIKTITDNKTNEEQLKFIITLITSLMHKKFYGEITIKFQEGKIVLITKHETLKI